MQVLSPLSTEYIRIPVRAMGYTVAQIKACTVSVAVVPFSYEPSEGDWYTASWAEGDVPYVLLLVGPGANINLSSSTSYDAWVRITTPAPVAPATSPISYTSITRAGTFRTSGVASTSTLTPAQFDQRAKTINLAVTLGDDVVMTFAVKENGIDYVWTGALVEGQVRATETSATVLTTFSFNTSTNGTLVSTLTDAQILALGAGTFYYSIRTTKNSITRTWVKGAIIISPAATQ